MPQTVSARLTQEPLDIASERQFANYFEPKAEVKSDICNIDDTAGVILLGIQHQGIPLSPKCTAYFDITLPTVPIFFSTDAAGGWLSPPIAVSTSLSLNGVEIALQAAIANGPTAPFGMALSNGVWVTIGY